MCTERAEGSKQCEKQQSGHFTLPGIELRGVYRAAMWRTERKAMTKNGLWGQRWHNKPLGHYKKAGYVKLLMTRSVVCPRTIGH